ncbi:hypothetical protein LTR09_005267 [Extremus antarcticus]|uniref:Uncharacterized protein n=1 Tax=Extremus antarcticus TaxID=702011 RepID=A0AAJ0DGE3_9PEZI|nr:hypothetical protein LTR09_005267 [Extremus antarcticus]
MTDFSHQLYPTTPPPTPNTVSAQKAYDAIVHDIHTQLLNLWQKLTSLESLVLSNKEPTTVDPKEIYVG